jgi:cyclophilin family peptidyl-prolyl cis-trans isomerase
VFGTVTAGMDIIDGIARSGYDTPTDASNSGEHPRIHVSIESVTIV